MSACCDGTGFISFIGDYQTRGRTHQDIMQIRRCPGYIRYFQTSHLLKEHPEKTPVLTGPGHCPAAIETHKSLITAGDRATKKGRAV